MFSVSSKTSWDTRTWLLGLVLGNFAGLLLLCGGYPFSRRFLEAAFPYSHSGYYTGDFMVWTGVGLGTVVFPAVLSLVARRRFALWGLLPIFLLLLWLLVGSLVARTTSSLFNLRWALILAAFLCWIIACFPISLFRFVRQHYRRPAASGLSLVPKRPLLTWVGRLILITLPLALVTLGWYNLKHPLQLNVTMQARLLSGKEARVPLIKHGTGIYVEALLNGQRVLCKIDTGSDTVEWPRGLHLQGILTKRHGQNCDLLGACVGTQTIVLPHMKIGDYEFTNLPTEMSDVGSSPFSPPPGPAGGETLLGNPAFVMTVLTIDYENAVMTIRPSQYDFTRQRRKTGDRVLKMGWTTTASEEDWERNVFGIPAVMAAIGGASFWCALDTGAGGPEIDLREDFLKLHPAIKRATHDVSSLNATHSSAQVKRLHDLSVKFPCLWPPHSDPISLQADGLVTPELYGGDGVIGLALMERYRMTIDYQRNQILLEPYALIVPVRKQEKPITKVNKTAI